MKDVKYVLDPVYWDPMTLPKAAFHMADRILEGVDMTTPCEEIEQVLRTFPRSIQFRLDDLSKPVMHPTRRVFPIRLRSNDSIFQIVSHDPNCVLWANEQVPIELGVGAYSFLRVMMLFTSFAIEHSVNLKNEAGRLLLPEVKLYALNEDIIRWLPQSANFAIGGKLYGICSGAVCRTPEPFKAHIMGTYKRKYQPTGYISPKVTGMKVAELIADSRYQVMTRGPMKDFIYQTLPPYVRPSVPTNQQKEFEELVKEVFGDERYEIEWPVNCDYDEVEQSLDEVERQCQESLEKNMTKFNTGSRILFEAGIFKSTP